jgi:2-polyprenyl-3-methyl-5-hydroxy-6-metoxy-1,4-benzoquinol methylase
MLQPNNNLGKTDNQLANEGQPVSRVNPLRDNISNLQKEVNNDGPAIPVKPTPPSATQTFGKSQLLDAGKILKEILGLSLGNVIADFGAGGGLFTITAARLVGEQGQVYAIDVIKNVLSEIDSKARLSGLYNIKTIWSNLEIVGAAKIPESSLDFIFIVNVLFQSKKQFEILSEASRLLKKGGQLLVIDWGDNRPSFAPQGDMKVDKNKVLECASQLDLNLLQEFKAGEYHFGLVFSKN